MAGTDSSLEGLGRQHAFDRLSAGNLHRASMTSAGHACDNQSGSPSQTTTFVGIAAMPHVDSFTSWRARNCQDANIE